MSEKYTLFRFGLITTALEVQFWFPVWLLFLLDKGLTVGQAAVLDGIFRLVAVLAEVPMGCLSDRIGRKKSLYAVLIGTTVTFLVIAAAGSFIEFTAAWILWGILWALISGLLTAYGWELGQAEGRAQEFVRVRRMCASVAMMVSLLTAGFIYELEPSAPFVITAALAALMIPVALGLPDNTVTHNTVTHNTVTHNTVTHNTVTSTVAHGGKSSVTNTTEQHSGAQHSETQHSEKDNMRMALLVSAVVLVAGWSIQILFQPLGLEIDLSPVGMSLMFAAFAGAQFVGAWLTGQVKLSQRDIVVGSLLGMAAACAVTMVAGTVPVGTAIVTTSALVMLGLFYAVGTTYCDIWVARLSTVHNRATMLSVVSLLGGALMVITRPSLGFAAQQWGAAVTFGMWGGVCILLAAAVWWMLRRADITPQS